MKGRTWSRSAHPFPRNAFPSTWIPFTPERIIALTFPFSSYLLLESCGNFRSGEVRAFFQLPLQMDTRASVLYSTNVYVAE